MNSRVAYDNRNHQNLSSVFLLKRFEEKQVFLFTDIRGHFKAIVIQLIIES